MGYCAIQLPMTALPLHGSLITMAKVDHQSMDEQFLYSNGEERFITLTTYCIQFNPIHVSYLS
jgi:hypothetical protein